MAPKQKSAMKLILSGMNTQKSRAPRFNITNLKTGKSFLDIFQKHGHTEINTAPYCWSGISETMLGELNCRKRGLLVNTKYLPAIHPAEYFGGPLDLAKHIPEGWDFDQRYHPDMLRLILQKSLTKLRVRKAHVYSLGPDRSVLPSDIFRGVNTIYTEGLFTQLGLNGLYASEVTQICEMCDREGWIKPSVYRGRYNALHRVAEFELIPCLRHYGISFMAFMPIVQGFPSEDERYEEDKDVIDLHRKRSAAIKLLGPVLQEHGLTLRQCSLKWLAHHSLLSVEKGDAVIIDSSDFVRFKRNIKDFETGPLPDEVVRALDRAWEVVRPYHLRGTVNYPWRVHS